MEIESNMKKSLRILTLLSVAASSLLFAPSANAVPTFDTTDVLVAAQYSTYDIGWGAGNQWKFRANINTTVTKVQVLLDSYFPAMGNGVAIYGNNSSDAPSGLLGTLSISSSPAPYSSGIATYTTSSPISLVSGTNYWLKIDSGIGSGKSSGTPTYTGSAISFLFSGSMIRNYFGYEFSGQGAYFAIFTTSPTTAPGAPTSVTATSTGATTANVSFTAPASDGGAAITSYTATSSPGGVTGSISQAGSGSIAMTGLTAGTAYTFTVKAINSVGTSAASSASNSVTTVGAPSSPTSVAATATGKRTATVSFAAPASIGGSAITSYKATSTPGGLTQTLTQASGGTFTFDGLQPSTAYTFAVTATNAIGTSAAATSNSITTTPLVVAALSTLSFADDGTGTGGKIVWLGTSIDAVLYIGSSAFYPGPYNYGAFTGGWNGRIRNLTPGTEYTVSLYAVSADGVGESKSLTFKTSATLPALAGAASATISRADQMATQLPKLFAWINENVFVDGEGDRMKTVLNKFDAMAVPAHSAFLKLPNSSVVRVSATSSTPAVCKVEGQVTVHSIAAGTCTISYTVSGGSKAPATMLKDFVFAKFAK